MQEEVKSSLYDKQASEHSKNAIFVWIVIGIIWAFIDKNINMLSVLGFLLFIPGIFIASFASMPLFLIRNKIALNIAEKKQERLGPLIPILKFLDLIEMIVAPIIYLKILNIFL